jgi:hypothetical protein
MRLCAAWRIPQGDRAGDEKIRRTADNLAAMIAEMHGVPCHVRIGDDFSFALVIREFGGDDGEAG